LFTTVNNFHSIFKQENILKKPKLKIPIVRRVRIYAPPEESSAGVASDCAVVDVIVGDIPADLKK
jgi:hypothetical protein